MFGPSDHNTKLNSYIKRCPRVHSPSIRYLIFPFQVVNIIDDSGDDDAGGARGPEAKGGYSEAGGQGGPGVQVKEKRTAIQVQSPVGTFGTVMMVGTFILIFH